MKLTIRSRVFLALLAMTILVMAAAGGGLVSTTLATRNLANVGQVNDLVSRVENLRQTWLSVNSIVDQMLLTRQTGLVEGQLNGQIEEFKRQLEQLQNQTLGMSPAAIDQNHAQVQTMQKLGNDLYISVVQLINDVQQGRWASAQLLRHTELVPQRHRFEASLSALSTNLKNDARQTATLADNQQDITRRTWILTIAAALVLAMALGLITVNSITAPIQTLIERVDQVTSGAADTLQPLDRQDEIGALSNAFALLTDRLRSTYVNMEQGVEERTRNLKRRTLQVETAAQVARDISATRDLDELLSRAVNLIRDRFQFYHAGIFLLDDRGEFAVLRSATGEAGRTMMERGHRLKVGEVGLVGYATSHGEARIAGDVTQDFTHFQNPLLPDTRAEIALPLKAGSRVIGALDVQSNQPNAFDEEDVTMLQIMADQLAVAIENARLLNQLEESLHQVQTFSQQYGERSWRDMSRARVVTGYEYDQVNLQPLTANSPADPHTDQQMVSIPLVVRDLEIGQIRVLPAEGETLMGPEEAMLQALSRRLSQTLESARLFEDTTLRAARQQMLNELSTNLSRSLDVDNVLRTVVEELGRLPAVSEVAVHVGLNEEPAGKPSAGNGSNGANGAHRGNGSKGEN